MKKTITLILAIIWVGGQYSCEKPILDNPFSSDITPDITLDNESLNGSTINTTAISISWTPNIFAFEFRYLLEPVDTAWSDWSSDTSADYNYLDEGPYLFIVKSRYEEDVEQEIPDSVSFTVNAITGPGLRIYPLYTEIGNSEQFTIELYAEEVTQLTGAEIKLAYAPLFVSLLSTSEGALLSAAQGQSVTIKEHNPVTGNLVLTLATALDGAVGITGTGSLARLVFTAQAAGSFELEISENSQLRTGADVPVLQFPIVSGWVVIE